MVSEPNDYSNDAICLKGFRNKISVYESNLNLSR